MEKKDIQIYSIGGGIWIVFLVIIILLACLLKDDPTELSWSSLQLESPKKLNVFKNIEIYKSRGIKFIGNICDGCGTRSATLDPAGNIFTLNWGNTEIAVIDIGISDRFSESLPQACIITPTSKEFYLMDLHHPKIVWPLISARICEGMNKSVQTIRMNVRCSDEICNAAAAEVDRHLGSRSSPVPSFVQVVSYGGIPSVQMSGYHSLAVLQDRSSHWYCKSLEYLRSLTLNSAEVFYPTAGKTDPRSSSSWLFASNGEWEDLMHSCSGMNLLKCLEAKFPDIFDANKKLRVDLDMGNIPVLKDVWWSEYVPGERQEEVVPDMTKHRINSNDGIQCHRNSKFSKDARLTNVKTLQACHSLTSFHREFVRFSSDLPDEYVGLFHRSINPYTMRHFASNGRTFDIHGIENQCIFGQNSQQMIVEQNSPSNSFDSLDWSFAVNPVSTVDIQNMRSVEKSISQFSPVSESQSSLTDTPFGVFISRNVDYFVKALPLTTSVRHLILDRVTLRRQYRTAAAQKEILMRGTVFEDIFQLRSSDVYLKLPCLKYFEGDASYTEDERVKICSSSRINTSWLKMFFESDKNDVEGGLDSFSFTPDFVSSTNYRASKIYQIGKQNLSRMVPTFADLPPAASTNLLDTKLNLPSPSPKINIGSNQENQIETMKLFVDEKIDFPSVYEKDQIRRKLSNNGSISTKFKLRHSGASGTPQASLNSAGAPSVSSFERTLLLELRNLTDSISFRISDPQAFSSPIYANKNLGGVSIRGECDMESLKEKLIWWDLPKEADIKYVLRHLKEQSKNSLIGIIPSNRKRVNGRNNESNSLACSLSLNPCLNLEMFQKHYTYKPSRLRKEVLPDTSKMSGDDSDALLKLSSMHMKKNEQALKNEILNLNSMPPCVVIASSPFIYLTNNIVVVNPTSSFSSRSHFYPLSHQTLQSIITNSLSLFISKWDIFDFHRRYIKYLNNIISSKSLPPCPDEPLSPLKFNDNICITQLNPSQRLKFIKETISRTHRWIYLSDAGNTFITDGTISPVPLYRIVYGDDKKYSTLHSAKSMIDGIENLPVQWDSVDHEANGISPNFFYHILQKEDKVLSSEEDEDLSSESTD